MKHASTLSDEVARASRAVCVREGKVGGGGEGGGDDDAGIRGAGRKASRRHLHADNIHFPLALLRLDCRQ